MTDLLQTAIDRLRRVAERMPEERQVLLAKRILETLPEETKADPSAPYERIKHLAGIFDGPGDLSTNPKYMEGFGEKSMR